MKRMTKALGAFALTLILALTLAAGPLCAAAQEPEAQGNYSGYLVMLSEPGPVTYSADPMEQATLMAAYNEREELLPLAESVGIYKAADLADIQNLVWSGQVQVVEPDYEAELFAPNDLPTDHADPTKPDDPYFIDQDYEYQYSLKDSDKFGISVRSAWDAGLTGEGVTVAVIDSGLNVDHVDAPAKIARGRYYFYREEKNGRYEFVINGQTRYYNYYSSDYIVDNLGHGTMVSGLIAAKKDNGQGIAGIAPNVTLLPIRCFTATEGHLGGYTSNLISGINYAVENGADIINMSWGIRNDSASLKAAITRAANAGCILLAAVGNDGASSLQYPAAYDNVIGVGSTDKTGYLSNFSQRNASVNLCAPGGKNGGHQIWSLAYNSNTLMAKGDGTSFAAPIAAGAIALLKEADPTMTQADFMDLLVGNCDEVKLRSTDDPAHAGLGRLNLRKLLDAMGYAGATLTRDNQGVTFRAAYHPVQSAAAQPDSAAMLLIGAYNAQGHLLDSRIAAATLSGYGAYSLSARFDDPDVATLRAFYLKNDAALTTVAPAVERAVE